MYMYVIHIYIYHILYVQEVLSNFHRFPPLYAMIYKDTARPRSLVPFYSANILLYTVYIIYTLHTYTYINNNNILIKTDILLFLIPKVEKVR